MARVMSFAMSRAVATRLAVSATLLLPYGIPTSFVNVPSFMTAQFVQLLIFALASIRIIQIAAGKKFDKFESISLLFFVYCVFVSSISSTFFFPISPSDWLPGVLNMTPILFILCANLFKLKFEEVIDGLILSAIVVSFILVVDQIVRFSALDQFVAFNSRNGSSRRIVLMHNECTFVFCILVLRAFQKVSAASIFYILAALLVGISAFFISESRLVLASALVGISLYICYTRQSDVFSLMLAGFAAIFIIMLPYFVTYFDALAEISNDNSVVIRNIEIQHFSRLFDQTAGFGFGLMSLSEFKDTILSNALYHVPAQYGLDGYWFSLVDIRVFAALYQFGWVGLFFVVTMTFIAFNSLRKGMAINIGYRKSDLGALAATIAGFMASPLPLNLFTVDNTVYLGGVIWFLSSKYAAQIRLKVQKY